jgi:hypothetical protein
MSAYVLFFGGYKASIPDIKAWTDSAIKQKPGVTFDGYPYPDASWDGEKAVKAFKNPKTNDYAKAIKKIEDSKSDVIYIVGHSSGCAVANEVDDGLKDHTKIILVALDGYAPATRNRRGRARKSGLPRAIPGDRCTTLTYRTGLRTITGRPRSRPK